MHYAPDGTPIDIWEWQRLFALRAGTVGTDTWWCRQTQIGEGVEVSTVWLGLDHNFGLVGPPLIWETMIFGGERDQYQWRYPTRETALDDHERIVRALELGTIRPRRQPNTTKRPAEPLAGCLRGVRALAGRLGWLALSAGQRRRIGLGLIRRDRRLVGGLLCRLDRGGDRAALDDRKRQPLDPLGQPPDRQDHGAFRQGPSVDSVGRGVDVVGVSEISTVNVVTIWASLRWVR